MGSANLLMVEPNPGILIVARNVLARAGYAVLAVSSARQGLHLVQHRSIDLLLLDAKQASAEVLEGISHARPNLPLILTVARGREVSVKTALDALKGDRRASLIDVLEKPFTPERLLQAVERALDRGNEYTQPFIPNARVAERIEGDVTDVYPFARLLQEERDLREPRDEPDDTQVNLTFAARAKKRLARYATLLEEQGVRLEERELIASLRALDLLVGEDAESGGPALMGSLVHLSIDQILQLGSHVEPPARCRLEHQGAVIDLFYVGGDVVFGRQENLPEGFRIGRFLVADGSISEGEVTRSLDKNRSGWIGQRLVEGGRLSRNGLRDALRRQTEELVYEVVRWRSGRFTVYAREPLPPEAIDADLSISIQHLLLEGMRRLDEWQRLAEQVGDLSVVLECSPIASLDGLEPEAQRVLAAVDGRRTVGDLVRTLGRPTFDIFRTLESLVGRRLIATVR